MNKRLKYFEEYRKCGCISDVMALKRDLPGYCPKHGTDRARVHKLRPHQYEKLTP